MSRLDKLQADARAERERAKARKLKRQEAERLAAEAMSEADPAAPVSVTDLRDLPRFKHGADE